MIDDIELYRFEDLPKVGQIEALHSERQRIITTGYLWATECFDSLFAYYDLLGLKISDFKVCFWDIGDSYLHTKKKSKYAHVLKPEVVSNIREVEGMLTGYCMDQTLYSALNECIYSGEENPNVIAKHLYDRWIEEARKDADITLSEEYIHSWFDHVGALFTEDGKLFTSKF